MSADDPKFNNERPLFFERFYQPFLQPGGGGLLQQQPQGQQQRQ
jgi:hypothetical protein